MRRPARARLERFRAHAAVVYGSGLEALPAGAVVLDELSYEELGWPCTAVAGHANVLRLAEVAAAKGARLRLALACGRPHRYEGWADEELERPVRDLAAAGVARLALTNSSGALRPRVTPGDVVVCPAVVDLQAPPAGVAPERLDVCGRAETAAVATALSRALASGGPPESAAGGVRVGDYVAVCGPQFETAAEVHWLSGFGDVVGMSAAPEVRAARDAAAECCLFALVANRAAEVGSHDEVLARGAALARRLSAGLTAALAARWPRLV